MSRNALIIFAKAPVPGQVKTRLMPAVDANQAARLHQQLLEQVVASTASYKSADVSLHCSPNTEHRFFRYLNALYRVALDNQPDGDLGQRMYHATATALMAYDKVVLIGSDCPKMSKAYIDKAFQELDKHSVVLGPAEDGGYVLVGLREPNVSMFEEVEWGSEHVLSQTLEKLSKNSVSLLDTLWDVDRAEDLARYRKLSAGYY